MELARLRKRRIERDLDIDQLDPVIAFHPNMAELYRRKAGNLRNLLASETARPQAVAIIRSLVERIDVSPGAKRGECAVILIGALAQILAYTQQQTTAASGGDGGTFLVVAGARYPLYRNKRLLLNFR